MQGKITLPEGWTWPATGEIGASAKLVIKQFASLHLIKFIGPDGNLITREDLDTYTVTSRVIPRHERSNFE